MQFICNAIIEEVHVIQLSQEDQLKLAQVLMNPPEPNDALKKLLVLTTRR